jgi:hypothetical protein
MDTLMTKTMNKVIRVFVPVQAVFFSGLAVALAGAPPRPNPVTAYDPYTGSAEPFYPYGWYVWRDFYDHAFIEHAGSGNTLIFPTHGTPESYLSLSSILDMANSHGKKVILQFLAPTFLIGVDPCKPESYAALATFVNAAKNSPALLCWLLADENEYNFPGTAQDIVNSAYVINHILDGHHQVWQNFSNFGYNDQHLPANPIRELPYLDETTVYSMDTLPYHVYDEPNSFVNVQWWQNALYCMGQKAVDDDVACAHVPQGAGFNTNPEPAIPSEWRLPTRKEFRWNAFSAITATGSRGTMYWMYNPNWYIDPNVYYNWQTNIAEPVFGELGMIARGMATGYNVGTVAIDWTNKSSDQAGGWTLEYDRVTQLLLYDDSCSRYFLIVTNNGTITQTTNLMISNLPVPLANQSVLAYSEAGTSSGISLTDLGDDTYSLVDTLERFDVVIYRLTGTPLTCDQAMAQSDESLKGDLNGDCYVNLKDFAILAQQWLLCATMQTSCE